MKQLNWDRFSDENPFFKKTHLKITFHNASLGALPTQELEALNILLELSNLTNIEALQTNPTYGSNIPTISIGDYNLSTGTYPITIHKESSTFYSYLHLPLDLASLAKRTFGLEINEDLAREIQDVKASSTLHQHIFITYSDNLLNHRDIHLTRLANIRTPTEALKIVALYLRSLDMYILHANPKSRAAVDQWGFYFCLARTYLPSMWRYFGACVDAGIERQKIIKDDDTLSVGNSILKRATRALMARDKIGFAYYSDQPSKTSDEVMYHFDYLTLLLSGIFDAQAVLAYRAYHLTKPKSEQSISFSNLEFKNSLNKISSAQQLTNVINQDYEDIRSILHVLRNSIHSAGLQDYTLTKNGHTQLRVFIPTKHTSAISSVTAKYASHEQWGILEESGELSIEPYKYSLNLIELCFSVINQIADSTDVLGLFPSGSIIPTLRKNPPSKDHLFSEKNMKSIALQG